MKQFSTLITTIFSSLVLAGCGSSTAVAPSQNDALNKVSPSGNEKKGYMQNSFDKWLQEDWTPTVQEDETVRQKYMQKEELVKSPDSQTTTISSIEELEKNSSEELSQQNKNERVMDVKYVEKKDKPFTLQELADKSAAYIRAKDNNDSNSHVKKLESMPVIGK